MRLGPYWLFLVAVVTAPCAPAWGEKPGRTAVPPPTAQLVLGEKPAAPILFGAEEIRRALERLGVKTLTTSRPSTASLTIYVGQVGAAHIASLPGDRLKAPSPPESYAVSVLSGKAIVVEGRDATGGMYGALEVAEQITSAPGRDAQRHIASGDLAARIKPVSKSPYLAIRGVNMFVTVQDIDDPAGAFWSDEYWHGYLDMMARDRYNLLDIHGPCDAVTLAFPNGFSYFVSLPDYPEVGVGAQRAARNLARFRQVISLAAERGIHVAYMNYEAPPPIGPWKTRRFGIDERWEDVPQGFLTGARLEDYTRQAVHSFLKQVPELWMFGFRVGESGQREDFYKKTYMEALNDFPESLNVYVRTWVADPGKVREIASLTHHHVYIEPKYNGEHLGLPYQAALGGRAYPPSGSYEDYTNLPRNFSILWQIRAHGTHRVFYWGWPDFARRTVRSCKFGDGAGFSMEPMEAYGPAADYLHHNPQTDHSFYKWMFEREWLWHLTWGRAAYDPDVSEEVWANEFDRRFGPQAGPWVFKAVTESSKIVPFIYAYHNVGLDHQDFAPEFETGDHALGARGRLWQGHRLAPYGGNNDDFLRVGTLDRTAMVDPARGVSELLENRTSGRMTPHEAADYLGAAADAGEAAIEQAAKQAPASRKEFDCIKLDVDALAWLARYYRFRIQSATHLEFYRRTYCHLDLNSAYFDLEHAVEAWGRLSEITSRHFGFVPEYIRMGVKQFRWSEEGRSLGVDLEQINDLEAGFQHLRGTPGVPTIVGHVPAYKAKPGRPLKITVTYATGPAEGHVFLFYRNSREAEYTKVPLRLEDRFERTWSGEIPAGKVVPGYLEYYFQADEAPYSEYGGTLEQRPPHRVLVNDNDAKPVISHAPPTGPVHGDFVTLSVDVRAKAQIRNVRVYYKRMPAYDEWLKLDMRPAGEVRFSADVPLTPEGILYYFEAGDEDGNAAHFPDFLKETPYFVIPGWNPQQ